MDFRKDIYRDFAVVFNTGDEGESDSTPAGSFAKKWGWFGVMHRLCNQDISNLERITKLNLLECLTWLTYETDLNSQTKTNYGSKQDV